MARIFYVHWNEAELAERRAVLEASGHEVLAYGRTHEQPALGDFLPQAVVLSLDRLPSHSRAIAEWFWEAKSRRATPLIFVGGAPEKVGVARDKYPAAHFCSPGELLSLLARILPPA